MLRHQEKPSRVDMGKDDREPAGQPAEPTIDGTRPGGSRLASGEEQTTANDAGGASPVTLIELAQIYAEVSPSPLTCPGPADRHAFHEQLRQFKHQVNRSNGSTADIKDYFFCSSLPAGVVLMGEPDSRLYLSFPPDAQAPPWIAQQLVQSEKLYIEIREILHNRDRVICLEVIFAVIVQLLRLMGNEDYRQSHAEASRETPARQASAARESGAVQLLAGEPSAGRVVPWAHSFWPQLESLYTAQVAEGWDLVRRIAERQAQVDYFYGMLYGALGLLLVVLLGSFGAQSLDIPHSLGMPVGLVPLLWLCPLVGGIGAVVSVMQRMSAGECGLRYRAGRFVLRLVGIFRPLIGAVFASVIVSMLAAGLMPGMSTSQISLVFYGVIAFLAGFSERWAQDMLGTSKTQLAAGGDAERRAAAT